MNYHKYKPFPPVTIKNRTWPEKIARQAPRWCSVDLRDGNQALPIPMNVEQKLAMFKLLVKIGFKEIEIGFPAAANVEYEFVRLLIEKNLIPDDVTVQVLTQAREHLIKKTCESLVGAKRAMVHMYNSTSELQRRVVFKMSQEEVKDIAVQGTKWVKKYSAEYLKKTDVFFEYSPESFMGTELDYAVEVCEAVVETWGRNHKNKVIINLPSTVELTTPNIWADQIEWFCRNFKYRQDTCISLHCHNDRGTAVAAAELGVLAGADRLEGTLFGNGERTGNVDIITLALNLYTQGIDPGLDFSNLPEVKTIYQHCTGLSIHERHPYSGELVFTAFSGSHQDAINKGLHVLEAKNERNSCWEVPYLPIDSKDVGREYEPIIRINSQSGKGGVAFIMEYEFGYRLPKNMHPEFGKHVQKISDATGQELLPSIIWEVFAKEYLERLSPFELDAYEINMLTDDTRDLSKITAQIKLANNEEMKISGQGNGPIDAFVNAWKNHGLIFSLVSYEEHALEKGASARAVAYIELASSDGNRFYGVGVDGNIITASLCAIISALNRLMPNL